MLMQESDWKNINHFTRSEKWGDWTKIESEVIYKIDSMRDFAEIYFPKCKCFIHCGYDIPSNKKHTETSKHYDGLAIDCHFNNIPLIDQYLIAERFNWGGIGVYPDWWNKGLHLDCRKNTNGIGSRWGQKTIDGENKYVELNSEFIKYVMMRTA